VLHPEGEHGLEDLWEQRRGCVGVHVNAVHGVILLLQLWRGMLRCG
jgi:hypothetical protein